MDNIRYATINSRWFANDLDYFESGSEFKVLSVHKDVINLGSAKYPRMLMVAVEGPVRGPSTIGLAANDFLNLVSLISEIDCFLLEKDRLIITGSVFEITLDFSCGERLFFKLDDQNKENYFETVENYLLYIEILRSWPSPGASAALLNLPGGEEYFRNKLKTNYPYLVQSLLKADDEEFLNRCRKIIGMGRGLTPTGDDLIHGALITLRYFRPSYTLKQKTVEELRILFAKTTKYGSHMIETGIQSLSVQPVLDFLKCFTGLNECREALPRLLKIGSSTGFDLAVAILYMARAIENKSFLYR